MAKAHDTWYGNMNTWESSASDSTSSGSSRSRASSPDNANASNQFSSKRPFSRRHSSEHDTETKDSEESSSGSTCSECASPASTFVSSSREATPEELQEAVKRRSVNKKIQDYKVLRPRWHTQSYMVLLALKQHPRHELSRMELMRAAVEMDKRISSERGLPRVFRGKTPLNSASAVLTNNVDNHFISFKPKGARSMRFKLAYETENFDSALAHYSEWMTKLIDHDWPLCFGVPRRRRRNDGAIDGDQGETRYENNNLRPLSTDIREGWAATRASMRKITLRIRFAGVEIGCHEVELKRPIHPFSSSTPTATTTMNVPNETRLEDLEIADVPRSLDDVVAVQPSTIPNAGNGLFARRDLPARVPLGFFFGVPMTEDEFDSLKGHVDVASQYCIMYQRTVLDGTDDGGNPYRDPTGPVWCPFHFMNESPAPMANVKLVEGATANQVIAFTLREIRENEELFCQPRERD